MTGARHGAAVVAAALLVCATAPDVARAQGVVSDRTEVAHQITGAAITRPLGAYARYDVSWPLSDTGLRAGLFDSFLVYSNELGAKLQYTTDPAIWNLGLEAAFEPGFFRQLPSGAPADAPSPDRTLGYRVVSRLQSNVNVQLDRLWLYSRSTLVVRFRDFLEDDTFQDLRLQNELSFEQATAVIVRFAGDSPTLPDPHGSFWAYIEHTVGAIVDVGVRPHRVSTGLIVERWPWDGISWNVDVFYSFAEGIDGPGGIVAWWILL